MLTHKYIQIHFDLYKNVGLSCKFMNWSHKKGLRLVSVENLFVNIDLSRDQIPYLRLFLVLDVRPICEKRRLQWLGDIVPNFINSFLYETTNL